MVGEVPCSSTWRFDLLYLQRLLCVETAERDSLPVDRAAAVMFGHHHLIVAFCSTPKLKALYALSRPILLSRIQYGTRGICGKFTAVCAWPF